MADERKNVATATEGPAALFFDIDGTLLVPGRDFNKEQQEREAAGTVSMDAATPASASRKRPAPSPALVAAFDELHRRGHIVVVSTGRPKCFLQQELLDLGFDGFICQAGASVELRGQTLYANTIPTDLLLEAAARMSEAGLDVDYESNEESASLYPVHAAVLTEDPLVRTVDELAEHAHAHGFAKFVLRGDQSAALEPVLPYLLEHFQTADMGQGIREFTLPGNTKREGVELILSTLGHGRANTFAFGDSENDLPMADAVETFVAMGNAFDVVKERANYITAPVAEDGVVRALEHFGLI